MGSVPRNVRGSGDRAALTGSSARSGRLASQQVGSRTNGYPFIIYVGAWPETRSRGRDMKVVIREFPFFVAFNLA
jgi:hypothetical protein